MANDGRTAVDRAEKPWPRIEPPQSGFFRARGIPLTIYESRDAIHVQASLWPTPQHLFSIAFTVIAIAAVSGFTIFLLRGMGTVSPWAWVDTLFKACFFGVWFLALFIAIGFTVYITYSLTIGERAKGAALIFRPAENRFEFPRIGRVIDRSCVLGFDHVAGHFHYESTVIPVWQVYVEVNNDEGNERHLIHAGDLDQLGLWKKISEKAFVRLREHEVPVDQGPRVSGVSTF